MYQPLTQEQFQKARDAGFSTEQIIANEKRRKAEQSQTQNQPLVNKAIGAATNAADTVLSVTGGKNVAESIGTLGGYAYTKAKDAIQGTNISENYDLSAPSPLQTAGDAAQLGLMAVPVAKVAGAAAKGIQALGTGAKVATGLGEAATSIGTGYAFDVASKTAQGKTGTDALAPGLGTALGSTLPVAGATSKAIKTIAPAMAPRIINSLIKPLSKQFSYGKDPGRTVAELGITANNMDELATNISSARTKIGSDLRTEANRLRLPERLHLSKSIQPFDDAITKAVENNDQALLNRLLEAKKALTGVFKQDKGQIKQTGSRLLDDLDYGQGLDFKQRIGNLTKWTGNKTEDETVNGALTRAYAIAKSELDRLATKADPAIAAKLRKLNQQYADLTSAEIATKYRDVLEKRHNLVNLPGKIGLTAAALSAPFTGGLSTVAAGLGSIAVDKALSSPAVKTRAAAALSKVKPSSGLVRNIPGFSKVIAPGDKILDNRFNKMK